MGKTLPLSPSLYPFCLSPFAFDLNFDYSTYTLAHVLKLDS